MALLENKTVLVTGSTTGIGRATVRRCVAEGAQVMVHGRDEDRARALVDELGEAHAAFVVADLADPAGPSAIVQAVIDRFGRIDGLVNNAALTTRSNLETTDLATFDRLFAVNLRAPLFLIQATLPYFRAQGGGVIVNVGSVNAHCGEPSLLVYSMTKGGLVTLTRNVADTYNVEGIRVNQINVGWTLTENERRVKQADGLPEGWEHNLPPQYAPAGRIFDPAEVAAHIVFWLSDAAGPVTGTVFDLEQFPLVGRNPDKTMD